MITIEYFSLLVLMGNLVVAQCYLLDFVARHNSDLAKALDKRCRQSTPTVIFYCYYLFIL